MLGLRNSARYRRAAAGSVGSSPGADMARMPFMDSSGIGVVLGRYRLLCLRGGSVALMHLTPQVRRIYDLSGMAQIIPVIEEKEAQGCN